MPKKILGRWLPAYSKIKNSLSIDWMGPLFADPNLFHINRASVSSSFFIGIFVAFLPLPGQTVIVAILALIFNSNLPIAIILIWISNPLTIAPILFFTYSVGVLLLGIEFINFTVEFSWSWIITQGKLILMPLVFGSIITGIFFGGISYVTVNQLWRWKVHRNWIARQKQRKDL
ncbi:MAG: ATP-binding protein [Porticoccus sp.]|jgi:uncharacterized protein (DUF2062 family)|nr:ATP-binding protein [Porticoccus sp.]|tara:strand:- start:67 stop:588 length:522 start_codon:yes stop_codon:yes gene_type:complete